MKSRNLLWLLVGMCLVAALFMMLAVTDKDIPNELAVTQQPAELENVDWCTVCVEQIPLYYKFCTVEVTNGNIIVPVGMTPADFCNTMAKFESEICLAESCK